MIRSIQLITCHTNWSSQGCNGKVNPQVRTLIFIRIRKALVASIRYLNYLNTWLLLNDVLLLIPICIHTLLVAPSSPASTATCVRWSNLFLYINMLIFLSQTLTLVLSTNLVLLQRSQEDE